MEACSRCVWREDRLRSSYSLSTEQAPEGISTQHAVCIFVVQLMARRCRKRRRAIVIDRTSKENLRRSAGPGKNARDMNRKKFTARADKPKINQSAKSSRAQLFQGQHQPSRSFLVSDLFVLSVDSG